MLQWQRICCPVDFSNGSRSAMTVAANFALRLGAELTLLHVYDSLMPEESKKEADGPPTVLQSLLNETDRRLDEWTRIARQFGPGSVQSIRINGFVVPEIIHFAEGQRCNLIVMGTRGLTGVKRVVLGSVAEKIVRSAPCPVLTVPRPVSLSVRKICCPIDFSKNADAAFEIAIELANRFDAELELLYVHELTHPAIPEGRVFSSSRRDEYALKEANTQLARRKQSAESRHRSVSAVILEGTPSAEIIKHVGENGVDLVVMGTAGKTGLERLLLGSVAERTVRMAHCPVLTLRAVSKTAAISR